MADRTLRLIYPPTMVNVPVIYQLIRGFDVVINIVGAQISGGRGWIEINIDGEETAIEAAVAWLDGQGIKTIPVID